MLRVPATAHGIDIVRFVTPTTDDARLRHGRSKAPAAFFIMCRLPASPAPRAFAEDEVARRAGAHQGAQRLALRGGFRHQDAGAGRRDRAIRRRRGGGFGHRAARLPKSQRARTRDNLVEDVLEFCRTSRRFRACGAPLCAKVERMNWITNFVRPRIKGLMAADSAARDAGESLEEMPVLRRDDLPPRSRAGAVNVCPQCGHHMRIGPAERFAALFDAGVLSSELPPPEVPADPLRFRDEKRYADGLKEARAKTGRPEALTAARGTIDGMPVMIAVQPFDFLGGSLGMGVGEALVAAMQAAVAEKRALHSVRVVRRRAHAGRNSFADADAARHHLRGHAARGGVALYRRADRSDLSAASARPTRCWATCRSPSPAR